MKKIISLILCFILIFSFIGCSDSDKSDVDNFKLPDGVSNVQLYRDMLRVIDILKHDLETKTVTYKVSGMEEDDFPVKIEEYYNNPDLTDKETKILDSVIDILVLLDGYITQNPEETEYLIDVDNTFGKELVDAIDEYVKLMNLDFEI